VMSATTIMSILASVDRDRRIYEGEADDCERATTGCIRFIASMSCMDGVILLDDSLRVHGFGVVIQVENDLSAVYLAGDALASPDSLSETSCENYGTRHRSVMRYCKANPGALGFVVSQDGDIRAIACVDSRIVMWEDIRVHLSYTTGPRSIPRSYG
jgi:DNA integrity scanning protein DisA with diadenylate cyclase activity